MKKLFFTILITFIFSQTTFSQGFNMDLVGTLPYTEDLSDIWTWTDYEGLEYALVGVFNGLSIVDISTPSNPVEVQFIPGANSIWRDIKTYNGYAYVINETSDGVLIVNLNELPNATFVNYTANNYFTTSHNIYIDEFGCAYISGANAANGGVIFFDLNANPTAPPIIGEYNENYVHDCYARNNILYTAEVYEGHFRVIDVSSKENPVVLGQKLTTSEFTHNIWPNDAGTVVFTTDETSGAFIDAYDITDLSNIEEIDVWQSNSGSGVIPHNVHVLNDYVVTSYYRDGVVVLDGSQPDVMVEVANYDTSPTLGGNGFNGCWGTTPFLPSGLIVASDIENGLYVLQPNYVRASVLKGNTFSTSNGNALNNVNVEIIGETANVDTDLSGYYATGIATAGTFDVKFSKTGYGDEIVTGVVLTAGSTTIVDANLTPQGAFTFNSTVTDLDNGNAIPNAQIVISDGNTEFNATTDMNGNIALTDFFGGTYDISVGIWGYVPQTLLNVTIDSLAAINIMLEEGYCDDFNLDFGWIASDEAGTGFWESGEPIGTNFNGSASNPDFDVNNDIGENCFVTGNGGGQGGTDDVDDGFVRLISPIFDPTNYYVPVISYQRWFLNEGGQGTAPDDYFKISLFNGTDTLDLEIIEATANFWDYKAYNIDTLAIAKTATMQLILEAADINEGHIVEAAFDNFKVEDTFVQPVDTTITDTTMIDTVSAIIENFDINLTFSENPFENNINISIDNYENYNALTAKVYNVNGKLIDKIDFDRNTINWGTKANSGIYILALYADNQLVARRKLVKVKKR